MIAGIIASIFAFYTIEAAVCIATYRYLKEKQRNENTQREKLSGLEEKLHKLNNNLRRLDDARTAQQKLRDEYKLREDLVRLKKAENEAGLIFIDEKVEQVIQTGPNDYIIRINRRYIDK